MEKKRYNSPEMNVMVLASAQPLLAVSGGEAGSGSGPDSPSGPGGSGSARPSTFNLWGSEE